ncbi:MAG: hypothetical protein Q9162_002345 [Coniocarpon cinnabarinum]
MAKRVKWSDAEIEHLWALKLDPEMKWEDALEIFNSSATQQRSLNSIQWRYYRLLKERREIKGVATASDELPLGASCGLATTNSTPHPDYPYHQVLDFTPFENTDGDRQKHPFSKDLVWGTFTILLFRGDPKWPSAHASAQKASGMGWGKAGCHK